MTPDAAGSQYEVCEDAPLNDVESANDSEDDIRVDIANEEMCAPTNGISKNDYMGGQNMVIQFLGWRQWISQTDTQRVHLGEEGKHMYFCFPVFWKNIFIFHQ